jgi:hypothetical protein
MLLLHCCWLLKILWENEAHPNRKQVSRRPREMNQQLTGGAHLTHAIFFFLPFDNIPILIFLFPPFFFRYI